MKWVEVQEIAIQLADAHPDVDPTKLNFVDLIKHKQCFSLTASRGQHIFVEMFIRRKGAIIAFNHPENQIQLW